ncbi:MAG: DNA polymerase III subunit gamma/tau [Bacteroidota bacterium]
MSHFVVSARKYRPQRFNEVVGQEHVTQTLKNALRTDHLAHAFLFCGPRGVGKTTCARILAKTINCENPTEDHEACGQCDSCLSFEKNASFNITELDAASNNSVEHIRALIEQVRFQPQQGKYKVFIIDEVHMLSSQAFNAFLKTLEEPPPYAIFILATTEKHKILPTILSRCQIFDFRRIQVPRMVAHLKEICATENITAEEDALHIVAQKADGALRDALSIFDRIVSYANNQITYESVIHSLNVLDYDYYFQIIDAFLQEDRSAVMRLFDRIVNNGFEPDIFLVGLAEHLRNILVCKDETTLSLLEVSKSLRERYRAQAQVTSASFILSALNLLSECDVHYKMARNKRLHVEMALLKITYLERRIEGSNIPAAAPTEKKNPVAKPVETKQESVSETPEKVSVATPTALPSPTPTEAPKAEEPPTAAKPQLVQEPIVATTPPPPKSKLRRSSKHSLVQLKSMDNITQEVAHEAETAVEVQAIPLDLAVVTHIWNEHIETLESQQAQNLLKSTQLTIVEDSVIATVPSNLTAGIIREEKELLEQLRTQFQNPQLAVKIKVDASSLDVPEIRRKKRFTPKEKYTLMMEVNPMVKEFIERLSLKLDEN